MNKALLMRICAGETFEVERSIDKKIENLKKMKLLSKVVSFARLFESHLAGDDKGDGLIFSSDLAKEHGKPLSFSFGCDNSRLPRNTSVFYSLDGKKGVFAFEEGEEFMELLELADGQKGGKNLVIDAMFTYKVTELVLGEKIVQMYEKTCLENHFWL